VGGNGISELSQREISRKVADAVMKGLKSDLKPSDISSILIMRLIMMETGFPVDHRDLTKTIQRTLDIIIKEHQFKEG
jgi:hypothetical protein